MDLAADHQLLKIAIRKTDKPFVSLEIPKRNFQLGVPMTSKRSVLAILLTLNTPLAFGNPDSESILIHPFRGESGSSLTIPYASSIESNAETLVRDRGLNPSVQLAPRQSSALQLQGDSGSETQDYNYIVDGFPLCDFQLKIYRSEDGSVLAFGNLPQVSGAESFELGDWADLNATAAMVGDAQLNEGRGVESTVQRSERCLLLEGGILKAVWRLDVMTSGLLYEALADGERIYSLDPKHFHANGSAKVFDSNRSGNPLVNVDLKDLKAGGFLANADFETCVATSSTTVSCPSFQGAQQDLFAQSEANRFDFDPVRQNSEFTQASIFANVNKVLSWAISQGYQNFGKEPIRLVAHATFANSVRDDDPNNALYQPGTPTTIYIGDGDGNVLKNLAFDEDVVSHEFGHHIVYHTVTSIKDEALVLHEGLADFFTFARTGNACLGETICPATADGESSCYVPRRCLRTGENELKWGSPNLPKAPHLRGQLVSGMVWDLYKADGIPLGDVTRMTLQAINFLVASSGYQHLILALMQADRSTFSGKYCERILSRAKSRGFGEFLADANCNASADARPAQQAPAAAKKSKGGACGVLSLASNSGQAGGILVVWLIPLIIAWLRRFRA